MGGVHVAQAPLRVLVKEKVRRWPKAGVILNLGARVGPWGADGGEGGHTGHTQAGSRPPLDWLRLGSKLGLLGGYLLGLAGRG